MKLHQLSVFLENKPHQVRVPTRVLADAGIDILTSSLADTEQFGILRLIVDDWQKAKAVLDGAGCVVKVTEVLALEVPDHPGGLDSILAAIDRVGLNIEYMYSCTFHRGDKAVLVFRFEQEFEPTVRALQAAEVKVLQDVDVFNRGRS